MIPIKRFSIRSGVKLVMKLLQFWAPQVLGKDFRSETIKNLSKVSSHSSVLVFIAEKRRS